VVHEPPRSPPRQSVRVTKQGHLRPVRVRDVFASGQLVGDDVARRVYVRCSHPDPILQAPIEEPLQQSIPRGMWNDFTARMAASSSFVFIGPRRCGCRWRPMRIKILRKGEMPAGASAGEPRGAGGVY